MSGKWDEQRVIRLIGALSMSTFMFAGGILCSLIDAPVYETHPWIRYFNGSIFACGGIAGYFLTWKKIIKGGNSNDE